MNALRIIDEIEQIVENSKGAMGKKLINDEEMYSKLHLLRSALSSSMREAEEDAAQDRLSNEISDDEKRRIIAKWSTELRQKGKE